MFLIVEPVPGLNPEGSVISRPLQMSCDWLQQDCQSLQQQIQFSGFRRGLGARFYEF